MKTKTAFALAIAFGLALTTNAFAQETQVAALKAQPTTQSRSPFAVARFSRDSQRVVDREFAVELAALAGAWTVDTISTHQTLSICPRCAEGGGLVNGSRSTPKIVLAAAAVDFAAAVVAYEWKKRVHNKYLHQLWRVPMLVRAEEHVEGAAGNWIQGNGEPAPLVHEKGAI